MPARKPQVGDRAHHRGGLDSRTVTRVEMVDGQWFVGLEIGSVEAWPCPAINYRFAAPPKCKIPHPTYSTYRCGKDAGHDGNHVGHVKSKGVIRARHWAPYLPTFHALTGGLR